VPQPQLGNAARRALEATDPEDTSATHLTMLRVAAGAHDAHTTERANNIAQYDQSLQQLQLQRQELEQRLEETRRDIDATQRSGKSRAIDVETRRERSRRERLKEDLLDVQSKANAMHTSTQSLMHVINSLRITRKRHVQRVHGLEAKERTMDNDAQFLLSSTSSAMEERERLRAKHERLRHEAAAWRAMQLKEGGALEEQLAELEAEGSMLEGKLEGLDEREKRMAYQVSKDTRQGGGSRELKFGFLKGQVAGWAAEFERVTAITGVRFGEGKSDAVDKVVSIYSANELRNKSLFKFVTEEVVLRTETLEAELREDEATASKLEVAIAQSDNTDAAAASEALEAAEHEAQLAAQLEHASSAVDALLPLVEKLGAAIDIRLPQHLEGVPLGGPAVAEFLALVEDRLHETLNAATSIVAARAPPVLEEDDEDKGRVREPVAEDPPPSAALLRLRALTKPRTLPSGKNATKILHNDSSERLLPGSL